VNTRTNPRGSGHESSTTTLGDVLYANPAKQFPSEQEWCGLVQAMAAGDQRALRALFARTHRIVFTLMLRLTGNRHTAEELTLDVFYDIWRRASSYDPAAGGSVLGWMLNQARSRAVDRLRFEQRKKRTPPDHGVCESQPVSTVPVDAVEAVEQGRLLRAALDHLSAEEREAIETAYFSELTYGEVAVRLEVPLGTVKTRIRSALMKLREAMAAGDP
jgi:RNA polymerase sigma-70 factor (ECF subfamily)